MPSTDDSTDSSKTGEPQYVTTFDPDTGERASEGVVSAVAALASTSPVELKPLYETVEPDALDSLVEHARRADNAGTHELWFVYEGYDVSVRSDGQIRIHDSTVPTTP